MYAIATGNSVEQIKAAVNDLISLGYKPNGNLIFYPQHITQLQYGVTQLEDIYMQPMIRQQG